MFRPAITLPRRKPLVTLRDAALYITKPPKADHDALNVAASRCRRLILVAEHHGPIMFAQISDVSAASTQAKNDNCPAPETRQSVQDRPIKDAPPLVVQRTSSRTSRRVRDVPEAEVIQTSLRCTSTLLVGAPLSRRFPK